MKYCFGVDIGGTTVKMGLFTVEGTVLDKWEIPTRTENAGEAILSDIATSLQSKIEKEEIQKEAILGIGVGIPAPVGADGIVHNTANLGWGYKEVKRELEELTGLPVATGNDANVAALGELWLGVGSGKKNMVMVTLGTGVGGGIVIDGHPLTGANGAGGEIGHVCVNYEEKAQCGCGKYGCLEQYASATGIRRLASERLKKDEQESVLRSRDHMSAKEVFDALKQGDKLSEEIVEEFSEYLGKGLAVISAVVDPQIIVIGGGVSKAGDIMFPYIKKHYLKYAFFMNREVEFSIATLGNDAGICGAAKLLLDSTV